MTKVSTNDFALAFGISRQSAHKIFKNAVQGRTWRGHTLPVLQISRARGGAGGKVFALSLDHCAPALKALLTPVESQGDITPDRVPYEDWQIEQQQARLAVIRPILATRKGTCARTAAVEAAAMKRHELPNGVRTVSAETIRGWVLDYERDGICGLIPKGREDKGKRRVMVSRAWDAEIDLTDDTKAAITEKIIVEARSMVSNDGTSIREVLRLSGIRLSKYCADHGSQIPTAKLKELCVLNRKWADREGLKAFNLAYTHDRTIKHTRIPRLRVFGASCIRHRWAYWLAMFTMLMFWLKKMRNLSVSA